MLLAQAGREEAQVEEALDQALALARAQNARALELRSATSLARQWHRRGRREEARSLLTSIYARFAEGFDTADLVAARALIEAIGKSISPDSRV